MPGRCFSINMYTPSRKDKLRIFLGDQSRTHYLLITGNSVGMVPRRPTSRPPFIRRMWNSTIMNTHLPSQTSNVAIQNAISKRWDIYGIVNNIAATTSRWPVHGHFLVRNRQFLHWCVPTSPPENTSRSLGHSPIHPAPSPMANTMFYSSPRPL